jgi:CheY-like chemotaxis protein
MPKIIVVDDDKTSTALFEQVLLMNKYDVITLNESAKTMETATLVKPDLIILDLMMPDVDGLAVLEAIKADPATRGIPIIVVTAKALTGQDHERLKGNIGALLSKGLFSEQDLLNDVAAALSRRSP